jgi:hypothetical protein
MDTHPLRNPKLIRVYDTTSAYVLDEYLTQTDDVDAFRRRAAPCTRVEEISRQEYESILRFDERWGGSVFRCFARCLRHEGISIHSLDRGAIERIMRDVGAAVAARRSDRDDGSV